MWKTIKGWFGFAEREIADIVSGFHKVINELEEVTNRKIKVADTKELEAIRARELAELARKHAEEATVIRKQLNALVTPQLTATPAA